MIKLYRKIRYNLLEKRKTAHYLKYAFGEIVLVVIGILIALQINNWNEHRKERLSWITSTKSLIKDLTQDTITLNKTIEFIVNDSIQLEKRLLRLSSPNSTIDTLKKIARYETTSDSKAFRPSNNKTLLAMQSKGTLELFDEETYGQLLNLQTTQAIAEEIIKANNSLFLEKVSTYMSKYSLNSVRTIEGPLEEQAWKDVDSEELYRTTQGFMASKKLMNRYTGKRYLEVLEQTEKVLSRLIDIQNGEIN
jgi:hypothetical protein